MTSHCHGILSVIVILLLTICLVSGADESGTEDDIINIGAIYNLEGSQAPLDVPSSQGSVLAAELYNKANPEKAVVLTIRDGKTNTSLIPELTEELISTTGVSVIVGLSDTDMLLPAATTAAAENITFLTSGATSPRLPEEITPFLFLACFGDNAQAAAGAEYAVETLQAQTAGILYDESMSYTTLLAGYFKDRFEELGGEVIHYSAISAGNKGLSEELANLSESECPDILYLAVGPDDASDAVRMVREHGFEVPVFGGDSYDTKDLIDAAAQSVGGVYYTTHAFFGGEDLSPEVSTFIAAYQEKFGEMPDAFAGLGYDAVNLAITAVENAEDTGDVHEGFILIDGYQGVTGTFSYTNSSPIPDKSVTLMYAGADGAEKAGEIVPEKIPEP